jgi:hypothetical protein
MSNDLTVEVRRKWETPRSIISELWIDGKFECFGLEPSRTTPFHPDHPCIPVGTYKVVLTMSPHFGYVTPEVLDVPGRTAIRWHIGNFPKDVLGCVVVGKTRAEDMVQGSLGAFTHLMAVLEGADNITAVYTDPEPEGKTDASTSS